MERVDAGGNPGRSWTLWEERTTSSSQRTTGSGIIQSIPCFFPFSPISYGLLLFHTPKLIAEQWFYWNSICAQNSV